MDIQEKFKKKFSNLSEVQRDNLRRKLKRSLAQTENLVEKGKNKTVLSCAQKRLWILEQFDRCPYLYHVPIALELESNVNDTLLKEFFLTISKNNEQLRSFFRENDGFIDQGYALKPEIHIEKFAIEENFNSVIELDHYPEMTTFFKKPFDFKKPPLFRVAIADTGFKQYLLLCFHHLIIDAESASIIIDSLYLFFKGAPETFKQVTSYQQYIEFELKNIQSELFEPDVNYWSDKLKNVPWTIDLPIDFPRPKHLTGVGASLVFPFSQELQQTLHQYAKQRNVTINSVILTTWKIVLSIYSNQNEILLGIPIAERYNKAWKNTIGLFVNTCLHVGSYDKEKTFLNHLQDSQALLLQDMKHAKIPYDYLIKKLYEEKICHEGASFNVLYNFVQIVSQAENSFSQRALLVLLPISKFDLSLHIYVKNTEITAIFEYSTELFCSDTIHQINHCFQNFLERFIANDQKKCVDHCLYDWDNLLSLWG